MAAKPIPAKLIVVLVLLGLEAVLNLISGGLVSAGIGIALMVGIVLGNDGVRTFLRGLAAVQFAYSVFIVITASAVFGRPILLVASAIGIASSVFIIWALGQNDVRDWMFRKSFHLDENPPT